MKKTTRRLAAFMGVAALVTGATATWAAASPTTTTANGTRVALSPGSGRSIVDWNQELATILKTPGAQPATVHPTRSYAILHAAVYDAVVSITHADTPYLFQVTANRDARPDAAANQAAHDTLVGLYPSMRTTLDRMLAWELAFLPSDRPTQDGIGVGHRVATLMLAARAGDGSAATPPPFVLPDPAPGNYQTTPPNHPTPVFTNWGTVAPFVVSINDPQFRLPPPPALKSADWAAAINEVQSLGQDTSTTRTPDETTMAKFWAPPIWNTWNAIADGQLTARRSNLESTAKVLESLNLTLADTTILLYDAKYNFLFWRPVTAIRSGTPGNGAVTANPTWSPLAVTAADPSYPGAHSSISEAAATVLTSFFGQHTELTVSSDALTGVTRQFPSFQAAATEAGLSRIFAGQHTRADHQAGLTLGGSVARFVLANSAAGDS